MLLGRFPESRFLVISISSSDEMLNISLGISPAKIHPLIYFAPAPAVFGGPTAVCMHAHSNVDTDTYLLICFQEGTRNTCLSYYPIPWELNLSKFVPYFVYILF